MTAFSDATLAVPPLPAGAPTPPVSAAEKAAQYGPQPDERDAQISALFTAMGRASKLSQEEIALRLQTTGDVIQALEEGDLDTLPEWDELSVVVERYAAFMNIDERPILRRLREQLTEHYLTVMSRHKNANAEKNVSAGSPMPMSDVSLKAFATGINEALPPLAAPASDAERPATPVGEPRGVNMDKPLPDLRQQSARVVQGLQTLGEIQPGEAEVGGHQPVRRPPAIPPHNGSGKVIEGQFNGNGRINEIGGARDARVANGHDRRPDALLQSQPLQRNRLPRDNRAPQNGQGYNAGRSIERQHYEQPAVTPKMHKTRSGLPLPIKIAANVAFVVILLMAFINWQPNRFWSGVDQLPKPIANSIYQIFELVMPDPLAMTYRMNWVHVEDPRMRKADRLTVPQVKRLPAIDFSRIGILPK